MKPIDVLLGFLTLAAVGLGFAAYRAWHPAAPHADTAMTVDQRLPSADSHPVRTPPLPVARDKVFYAWDEKLPDGYRCSGANGLAYRTRMENGAAVIEPLVAGGVTVRCGGDARSSYRKQ